MTTLQTLVGNAMFAKGWTPEEVQKKGGPHKVTIVRILKGGSDTRLAMSSAARLAATLMINPEEFKPFLKKGPGRRRKGKKHSEAKSQVMRERWAISKNANFRYWIIDTQDGSVRGFNEGSFFTGNGHA